MSGKILIIGQPTKAADLLFAGLGVEYDVRAAAGNDFVPDPIFIPDAICLCFTPKPGGNLEPLVVARTAGGGMEVPVMVFSDAIPGDLRAQLIRAGATEVFSAPYYSEEVYKKIARLIHAETLSAEVLVLQNRLNRLSQYFSVDVVEKIMSQGTDNHIYGENVEATIFFLDIRNFTSISEKVEPNQVAALLNQLYTDFMDLILTFKGSVNKIIGDALLATFGCPVRGEKDASNAVHCALAIRDTLKFFNETRPAYLTENISIGMGIATGKVFAGTIGSYRKMDYTVIGDTVNIAARLEGLTKQTRFDLIIDSKTRALVGDEIQTRKLKVNRVRGRTQPMEIFLVDGPVENGTGQNSEPVIFKAS